MAVNKDDFRDTIIKNAKTVFSKFGFRKTTMDEIAASVRKGKSSIYYYFSSKEDVFNAVVEQEANELRQQILGEVSNADSALAKLRVYIITRLKTLDKMNNLSNALRNDYLMHLDFIAELRTRYRDEEIQAMKDILDYGVKEEHLNIPDVDITATAIVLMIGGLELNYFIQPHDEEMISLEAGLDHILDMVYNGLKT
ncbi:MAG: TetR family transcriptional regulator [Bacteroidetes bacterium]|nr:MAG: TetR family transcriptional regulator [Bacteroidota bacterium]PIE88308.1 MAG: TetR family transcriptional regulator [Bacteroidota bacterium]